MTKTLKGFTLIELLISISIFSLIAVVMYACFRSGIAAYGRISQEAAFQQKLRFVLSVVEKDFRNAYLSSSIAFKGEEHRLSFASLIDDGDNAPIGTGRISYETEGSGNDLSLIRRRESLRQAMSAILAEYSTDNKTSVKARGVYDVLLDKVLDIKFSYLYLDDRQLHLDGGEDSRGQRSSYEWIASWQEDVLPLAIRIEIVYLNPNTLKAQRLIKRVKIPTARPLYFKTSEV
ncbi:MAG: prepilin-type N-terminal cleavage/methylation domain-containing protein [Candidatus Omnitrophota bacterium]|jgi:prepilin-type N-terminal cleavage/methylation domain-containing protein